MGLKRFQTQNKFKTSLCDRLLIQFIQASGLTVTRTYSNRLLVDVLGNVETINRVFNTRLSRYQKANGKSFFAPASAPSIGLGLAVLHVAELNNLAVPQHGGVFKKTVPLWAARWVRL
ncbi:MAG: protease pro-enzyme activation domain-containing protein [bacterium]